MLVHLQQLLHWHRDDAPEEKRATLERMLATCGFPQPDTVPLPMTLQQLRQRTLDALLAWRVEEAERQPVLMVWEDLHWTDPSSLELLGRCIDQMPTARLLLLLTFRPGFHPPSPPWPQLTQLTLNRFSHQQSAEIVARVASGGVRHPRFAGGQGAAGRVGVTASDAMCVSSPSLPDTYN